MSKMNTINETAKLCKENQIGISRNHIRYLAANGFVPSVKIGNKILINWEQLKTVLVLTAIQGLPTMLKNGLKITNRRSLHLKHMNGINLC